VDQLPISREGIFQELLGLARHSFLTYVVESSSPVVVDDADKRLLALFHEIWEKERYYIERAYELLDKSRIRPLPPMHSLKASTYNFLRPVKLAEHWNEAVSDEIARLSALRERIGASDPCVKEFGRLLDDFIALRRESLRRVTELLAEVKPKVVPPAAATAAPAAAPKPSP
jgi:hypothetical protein